MELRARYKVYVHEIELGARSKDENQQQTQPTYDAGPGIEPGPHWWEASALTTAPSLLPLIWEEWEKGQEGDWKHLSPWHLFPSPQPSTVLLI